jgi:hypothetical protein
MSTVIDVVKKSLENYDKINNKYKLELSILNKTTKESGLLNITKEKDQYGESWIFDFLTLEKKYSSELLGIFNYKSRVFSWSYVLPKFYYGDTYLTKRLLNYSLENEPEFEYDEALFYLKVMFSNSRFNVDTFEELEVLLAVSAYVLKDNIKFIATRKEKLSDDDYLLYFYLIKN